MFPRHTCFRNSYLFPHFMQLEWRHSYCIFWFMSMSVDHMHIYVKLKLMTS
jgi:hypothetical protein